MELFLGPIKAPPILYTVSSMFVFDANRNYRFFSFIFQYFYFSTFFLASNVGVVGGSTLVVNPSGGNIATVSSTAGLSTTAASFAAINRKMQNVGHVTMTQIPSVSSCSNFLFATCGNPHQLYVSKIMHTFL